MSTLPLEVHEVLEEEYRAMYKSEPAEYGAFEIVDEAETRRILLTCGIRGDELAARPPSAILRELVDGARPVAILAHSPAITDAGREIIVKYPECVAKEDSRAVNRRVVDDALRGAVTPLVVEEVDYAAFEKILDKHWARAILRACGEKRDLTSEEDIKKVLAELVDSGKKPEMLEESPALTGTGRMILADYAKYTEQDKPKPSSGAASDTEKERRRLNSAVVDVGKAKRKVNRRIVDEAMVGAVKPLRDTGLARIYAALHDRPDDQARTALCISGGGIRSATFALGVIQGLASARILDKFDYLSTVSGGGYIGSWLSSWVRRHKEGMTGVQKDLAGSDTAVAGTKQPDGGGKQLRGRDERPQAKVTPEPPPIRHLRDYSNYLSPKLGFTSTDTWTLVSLYLRNLLLNLLVLVPILAALLAIPRYASLIQRWSLGRATDPATFLWWALGFLALGFAYIGGWRPVEQGREGEHISLNPNGLHLLACVFPLTGASISIALFWASIPDENRSLSRLSVYLPLALAAIGLMTVLPSIVYYIRYIAASAAKRRAGLTQQGSKHIFRKLRNELVAVFVAVATSCGLFYLGAAKLFPDPMRKVPDLTFIVPFLRPLFPSVPMGQIYICFAVPVVLMIFYVQASIFVGLSGRVNEDDDREWWGRAGAWLLFSAAGVATLGAISLFGPVLLYRAPAILASMGGLAGIGAAVIGFSAKTPASDKQKETGGTKAALSKAGLTLAVPLFVVVALAGISLGTTWLLQRFDAPAAPDYVKVLQQFTSQPSRTLKVLGDAEVKSEAAAVPIASMPVARGIAHLQVVEGTTPAQALGMLLAGLASFGLSFCISANKFSMHALYRNRLIRAYLGASRYTRDPDRFTGFDENDNLQMYELRHDLVWSTFDAAGFVGEFTEALREKKGEKAAVAGKVSELLRVTTRLSFKKDEWIALLNKKVTEIVARNTAEIPKPGLASKALELVRSVTPATVKREVDLGMRDQLILCINAVLLDEDLQTIAPDAAAAAKSKLRFRRNREIFQSLFPSIGAPQNRGPLHVVNTALNLVSGDKLAWQERMAESFTVSPFHSGSLYVGYRDSRNYGGPEGISLGTAVTISGAAASPNQGYNSSMPMAFLLTLFNVRLGWWLGNPGVAGRLAYRRNHPGSNVALLFREIIGATNDRYKYVYLSDGGHFENLGLYEMIVRRCRFIVVSDAGCDPKYTFEDLGNAIRKIRTDLGVPVDIKKVHMFSRVQNSALPEGRYMAQATIRYSAIDDNAVDGTLIYIKPGVYTSDYFPRDVYNYALSSCDFPHESTADQFFSESQFESYRALGRHAINEICGNYEQNAPPYATVFKSVAEFTDHIEKRWRDRDKVDPATKIAEAINSLSKLPPIRPAPSSYVR